MAARHFRDAFDPSAAFLTRRMMRCAGVDYKPGEPFDKSSVTLRRLQQLFDQRALCMADEDMRFVNRAPAPRRFGRWALPTGAGAGAARQSPPFDEADMTFDGAMEELQQKLSAPEAPIPENFRDLKWFGIKALAKRVSGVDPSDKVQAVALIEHEIERRGQSA